MSELPQHLKYRPSPEIVRAHSDWQNAFQHAAGAVKAMGHVRAPEAIAQTVLPLFAHLDNLFTILQADLSAYAEQVMALSQDLENRQDVLVGLHPDDVEDLVGQLDEALGLVKKTAGGLKDGTDQRKDLDSACEMLGDLRDALESAALDDEDLPDDQDDAPDETPEDDADPLQIT